MRRRYVHRICEGVICDRGVREARLDINLLCCLHKCPIKNITDLHNYYCSHLSWLTLSP